MTTANAKIGPNPEVLEAQARVCTGPHQTRPLGKKAGDPDPAHILKLITDSAAGHLDPANAVSQAQMGAFFAGMTIRLGFPPETAWSKAEMDAFRDSHRSLQAHPDDIRFVIQPADGLASDSSDEKPVIRALGRILKGCHLDYAETHQALEAIVHGQVRDSLKAALLIGQRMNRETGDELRAYLDVAFPPGSIRDVDVTSLTHLGEPYDGSARYFRPTVFVAAVRAALGRPSALHGTDQMPPKLGVTDEQVLDALGARTDISMDEAASMIEDPAIGFAYVSQSVYAPGLSALRELRFHIKKRPAWSTTEKAQQIFSASGDTLMTIGFFHSGYEGPLLQLMESRGLKAGLAIKGDEGTSHLSLRLGKPSSGDRRAINYAEGFRVSRTAEGEARHRVSEDVSPAALGFQYSENPRFPSVTPRAIADAGTAALSGEAGPDLDRILLNVAAKDHLLGFVDDLDASLALAKDAVLSGKALAHLNAFVATSNN